MFSGSRCYLRANARRPPPNLPIVQSSQSRLSFLSHPWFTINDQPCLHHPTSTTTIHIRKASWLRSHQDFLRTKGPGTQPAPGKHVDSRAAAPTTAPANSQERDIVAVRSERKSGPISEVTRDPTDQRVEISQKDVDNSEPLLRNGIRAAPRVQSLSASERTDESRSPRLRSHHMALKMLLELAPTRKAAEGEVMWLSRDALELACGTSQQNSWIHHAQDGCSVHVTGTTISDSRSRVLLRGSLLAREMTRAHLLSFETTSTPSIVRFTQSQGKSYHRDETLSRVGQISKKAVDSLASFLRLVEAWTAPNTPRLAKQAFRNAYGRDYDRVVAQELIGLLINPSTARFASAAALDRVFHFLGRRTGLDKEIMFVYRHFQKSPIALTRRTYNSLLVLGLRAGNMSDFRQLLSDMAEEGLAPDFQVWQAILRAESSLQNKYALTALMAQKGFLQDRVEKSAVVGEIAMAELIATSPAKVPSGNQFISSMDIRFGTDWITEASLKLIWRFCEGRREYSLALDLLAEAQRRGVHLTHSTPVSILRLLLRRGNLKDSLLFLRSHLVRTTGRNDNTVIPVMFQIAWRRHSYNVCRVLWAYAALKGLTSKRMQQLVTNSLLQRSQLTSSQLCTDTASSAGVAWQRQAGVVIVGVGTNSKALFQPTRLTDMPPVNYEVESDLESQNERDDVRLAQMIVQSDFEAWKRFATPSSARLSALLDEAYNQDETWKLSGIGLARGCKSVDWMVENSIEMNLVKRETGLSGEFVIERAVGDREQKALLAPTKAESRAFRKVDIKRKLPIKRIMARPLHRRQGTVRRSVSIKRILARSLRRHQQRWK